MIKYNIIILESSVLNILYNNIYVTCLTAKNIVFGIVSLTFH